MIRSLHSGDLPRRKNDETRRRSRKRLAKARKVSVAEHDFPKLAGAANCILGAYADQSERDHALLMTVRRGDLEVETEPD